MGSYLFKKAKNISDNFDKYVCWWLAKVVKFRTFF